MKTSIIQSQSGGRPRWMIVDDNPDILRLVRDMTARFSEVNIEGFTSPQAALETFEAEPEAFKFIITDLEMPGMRSIELCHRLLEFARALKVLLSKGSEIISDKEVLQKDFCGLLHKLFAFAALQRARKPATLKYSRKSSSFNDGLRLVRAS